MARNLCDLTILPLRLKNLQQFPIEIELHEEIEYISKNDPELASVTEMRLFLGLSTDEIARVLGVSDSTVKRSWRFARAILKKRMCEDEANG